MIQDFDRLPSWLLRGVKMPSAEALKDEVVAAAGGDARARERVILSTVRWVAKRAAYWAKFGKVHRDDLIAEGMNGVNHAIDLYDRAAGTSFLTYATRWIDQKQQRRMWQEASAVVDKSAIRNGAGRLLKDVSLDAPLSPDDGDAVRLDFMVSSHNTFEIVSGNEERARAVRLIAAFSEKLDERKRHILKRRFLEIPPATMETVAMEVTGNRGAAVSRERVRQIENAVLERLARHLGMPRSAAEIKANLRMMEAA